MTEVTMDFGEIRGTPMTQLNDFSDICEMFAGNITPVCLLWKQIDQWPIKKSRKLGELANIRPHNYCNQVLKRRTQKTSWPYRQYEKRTVRYKDERKTKKAAALQFHYKIHARIAEYASRTPVESGEKTQLEKFPSYSSQLNLYTDNGDLITERRNNSPPDRCLTHRRSPHDRPRSAQARPHWRTMTLPVPPSGNVECLAAVDVRNGSS